MGPPVKGWAAGGAAAALVAGLLALVSVVPRLPDGVIGIGGVDHYGTLWTWEQARLTWTQGPQHLVHHASLYFPFGQELLRNTGGNVLDGLLAAPLAMLGFPLGHNIALILLLLANGIAAGRLARLQSTDADAPFAAGIFCALNPYVLYELVEGRPTQALLAPLIVAIGALFRLKERPSLLFIARATGALIITGLFYWYYALFLAIFGGVLGLVWAARPKTRAAARGVLATLVASAVLVLPIVGPLIFSTMNGQVPGLRSDDSSTFLLHSFQPLLGRVVAQVGDSLVGTQFALSLCGATAILISFRSRGTRLFRGALVLVGLSLAIGPYIVLAGSAYPMPTWTVLTELLPPLDRLWHPSRALALLVVAGIWGITDAPRALRWALVVFQIGEVARDGLLPLPVWTLTPSAVDLCLRGAPGTGAVIDLPFAGSQANLYAQVVHGRPILGGMHEGAPAMQPAAAVHLRQTDAFLRQLLRGARGLGGEGAVGEGAVGEGAVGEGAVGEGAVGEGAVGEGAVGEGAVGEGAVGEEIPSTNPANLISLGFGFVVFRPQEFPASPAGRALRRRAESRLEILLGTPTFTTPDAMLWTLDGGALACGDLATPPDATQAEEPSLGATQLFTPVAGRWVRELGSWTINQPN